MSSLSMPAHILVPLHMVRVFCLVLYFVDLMLAVLPGLHVATVYKFIKTIMITSKRNERTKEEYMWISCIGVLFALGTVNISCIVHFNELAWIDMRNYPGGPVAFFLEQSGDPSNVGSIATATLVQTASGLVTVGFPCLSVEGCASDTLNA